MTDQQRAAMQMALDDLRVVWLDSRASITALREALKTTEVANDQTQEIIKLEREIIKLKAIILEQADKLREALAQPQGEPVAWMNKDGWIGLYKQGDATIPLYTTPSSVEAAIEATKEKAAKVCEAIRIERIKSEWDAGHETGCSSCAAAIRSMK